MSAPLPCDISQSHIGSSENILDDSGTRVCDSASPLSKGICQPGNEMTNRHDMTAKCKEHTNSFSFKELSGGVTTLKCNVLTDSNNSFENIEHETNCRDCEHMDSVCQEIKTTPDSIETDSVDVRKPDSEHSMELASTLSDSTLDEQCDGRDNMWCECPVLGKVEISEQESGDECMMHWLRHLKQHQQSLMQFVGTVLNSRGSLGLNQGVPDNELILKEVNKLMNVITQEVESRNALFRCQIRLSGSWDEGTKVDYPDEFDYQLTLILFSVAFQPIEVTDEGCQRYVRFILKDEYISQSTFSQFVDDNNYLDSRKLVSTLYKLINTILYELHSTMNTNLYPVKFLNTDKSSIDKLSFRWVGCNHKNLLIDIDVVPTLTPSSWIPNCIDQSKSILQKLGIELSTFSAVIKTQDSRFAKNWNSLFRISTGELELKIFKSIHPTVLKGYVLVKAIRETLYNPQIYMREDQYLRQRLLTTYLLKTCFFYELDHYYKHISDFSQENASVHSVSISVAGGIVRQLQQGIKIGFIRPYFFKDDTSNLLANNSLTRFNNERFYRLEVFFLRKLLETGCVSVDQHSTIDDFNDDADYDEYSNDEDINKHDDCEF